LFIKLFIVTNATYQVTLPVTAIALKAVQKYMIFSTWTNLCVGYLPDFPWFSPWNVCFYIRWG